MLLLATAFFANDLARFGGFAVALGGFGFSVYLTYLELFKIEAICQWCVASAVLMTILFALNAIRLLGYAGKVDAGGGASSGGERPTSDQLFGSEGNHRWRADEQQEGEGEAP